MTVERAEAESRIKMTNKDKREYKGVARHPLARKWMLQKFVEAREQAEAATDAATRERWTLEANRMNAELRRLGVGGGK